MKQQIRLGVFETNSSSTHAMAVQSYPNVLYAKYTHMTDEDIEKQNKENSSYGGYWSCPIIKPSELPKEISFKEGEFGWIVSTITTPEEKASYLYTLMYELLSYDEFVEVIKHFKKWFKEEGITATFQEYYKVDRESIDRYDYRKNTVGLVRDKNDYGGYVDHPDEAEAFMCYVMCRKNHLFNYLFGDSIIKTGNDNDDCDISLYDEDKEYGYKYCHQVFYKGN